MSVSTHTKPAGGPNSGARATAAESRSVKGAAPQDRPWVELQSRSPRKGFASETGGLMWTLLLGLSIVSLWGAAFLIDDPLIRVGVCVAIVAPIVWASVRLTQLDAHAVARSAPRPPRRFSQLRTRVVGMLEEIKRLNWLAVDARNGIRDRDELLSEMDEIEDRLNGMIEGIREVAGQG